MTDFIHALTDPHFTLVRYALIAGILSSLAFGVVGTYVVVRRISYIAGSISHCCLAGIGAALYFSARFEWPWCRPMLGALVASLIAALIIGVVSLLARQREDTVIGALWAVGMAIGLLFIAKTPGYVDPMSYLFGNILLLTLQDLWYVVVLDAVVLTISILFHNRFLAVCFDEEYASLRGIRVHAYYLLLLCLTALTIVLMVSVVGIVMVIALFTLPAAVAGHCTRRLRPMMVLAVLFCAAFTTTGLGLSYSLDLPTGPVVIMVAGMTYLGAIVLAWFIRRVRASGGRRRLTQ